MKLFERQTECREIAFFERAAIIGIEGFTKNAVNLALHFVQLLGGISVRMKNLRLRREWQSSAVRSGRVTSAAILP